MKIIFLTDFFGKKMSLLDTVSFKTLLEIKDKISHIELMYDCISKVSNAFGKLDQEYYCLVDDRIDILLRDVTDLDEDIGKVCRRSFEILKDEKHQILSLLLKTQSSLMDDEIIGHLIPQVENFARKLKRINFRSNGGSHYLFLRKNCIAVIRNMMEKTENDFNLSVLKYLERTVSEYS